MGSESLEFMAASRDRLEHRREELRQELADIKQDLIAATTSEAEEGTLSTHQADEATDLMVAETSLGDIHTLEAELAEIDTALERINRGTYGRCAECGQPIDPARLAALPTASRCLACEARYERTVDDQTA
ncbi:TraR/DksA family transcriptional regulator [Nitrolancea hollandica]|uniref:Transcriptional regulator, TraR/DksA family n=1 Tax=Nitrolancea hollandica Lb TaxID=1129897 RepID=I4EEI3_9BACT|nr:TraR/DksA C4-type zinc finger protein [Nitrolancea hollandica]CCF83095.1 Transcriptional regulator, TraR/DksA family [Nitrolancea hollandica Lb]